MYVLMVLYIGASNFSHGWTPIEHREEFDAMKTCQERLTSWKANLHEKFINGNCYYKPLHEINR